MPGTRPGKVHRGKPNTGLKTLTACFEGPRFENKVWESDQILSVWTGQGGTDLTVELFWCLQPVEKLKSCHMSPGFDQPPSLTSLFKKKTLKYQDNNSGFLPQSTTDIKLHL